MKKVASYSIDIETANFIVLKDEGPWDQYMSITNAAESVVAEMNFLLGRRLYYYDSEGQLTEIKVKDGKFAGFAPAKESDLQ
jgi:hypothetical protein